MRREPIIAPSRAARSNDRQRIAADGQSFAVHEWRGSGPPYLHVHHEDDEAWHVLEGKLRFRFADRTVEAGPGSTVFVPAGVAHTYEAFEDASYLVILTPRLRALIAELQSTRDRSGDDEIFRRHSSEVLE
jgi:mannose-6-phosphate isomerase-like protein (cupin superfamily)